jgi:glycosyltransferase involved in cell wall biosynthesis
MGLVSDKKVVCMIIPTTDAGGTENYALRLIKYLQGQYIIIVWSVGKREGVLFNQFKQESNELISIPVSYSQPGALFTYIKILKQYKVETLLNFNGDFAGISMLAASLLGIEKRIVFYRRSTHAFRQTFFRRWYNAFVHALVDRYATAILSNSNTALNNFFGRDFNKNDRCRIISNGIDSSLISTSISREEARAALNIPFTGFLIGHVGRIDPAKNHTAMLDLIAQFKADSSSINFLFCGKDTDEEAFRKEINSRGLLAQVWLMGQQEKMALVYRALDAFIFPSVTEGQPNALIEAIISGLPVVASNIEPIKEAVPQQMHSMLVSPYDIKQMANQLLKIKEGCNPSVLAERQQWAIMKYDHLHNFNLVKGEL